MMGSCPCLFGIFMLAVTLARAQGSGSSFAVSIGCPKTTLPSGEAIRVDITLKSQPSELVIVEGLRTGPRGARIIVWDADGKIKDLVESAKDKPDSIRRGFSTVIPPGRSVTEPANVSNWFDLSKPSQYSLQVRKRDPISGAIVESNKLTITILPKS
jgi:hypothetical protein